jgi:hypothetical protein
MLYFQGISGISEAFAQKAEKENCKYHHQFIKSVQPFHAKEVCPTFRDRPLLKLLFSPIVFFDYNDADIVFLYGRMRDRLTLLCILLC